MKYLWNKKYTNNFCWYFSKKKQIERKKKERLKERKKKRRKKERQNASKQASKQERKKERQERKGGSNYIAKCLMITNNRDNET